jgi:hypothetical protein
MTGRDRRLTRATIGQLPTPGCTRNLPDRCPSTHDHRWTDTTTHRMRVRCELDAGHTGPHWQTLVVRGLARDVIAWTD